MQAQTCGTQADRRIDQNRWGGWMFDVLALLDAAVGHLHPEQAALGAILEATSLLRRQVDPQPAPQPAPQPLQGAAYDGKERLLAWQARKVLDYIDTHITSRMLVADLCALVWRSEAHFSRSFRGTFGHSPHAFVVRRRIELAAKYMLDTDMSLSDIALGCGFVDQAHLCKHFRVVTGETPAAWRRAKRGTRRGHGTSKLTDTISSRYSPPTSGLCTARRTQASNSSAANGFMR
jgi:AraC-like DNA-binding protein